MCNSQVLLFTLLACCLVAGCQAQGTSLPPAVRTFTVTPVPSLVPSSTLIPAPSATPIPLPTVTLPAPLAYKGALSSGVVARLGWGEYGDPNLSPDGDTLAVSSGVGIVLYHAATLEQLRILPEESRPHALAWSPDGHRIAVDGSKELAVYDASSGTQLNTLEPGPTRFNELVWRPDSQALAYSTWAPPGVGSVFLWRLTDPKAVLVKTQRVYGLLPADMRFSPDGKRLALAMGEEGLVVLQP